jgi:hypothetical protein
MYLGAKVLKVVKCAKCRKKMYIVDAYGAEGSKCFACGKYFCYECLRDLYTSQYRCCSRVATEGVQLQNYYEELPKGMSEEEIMNLMEKKRH